MSTFFRALEQAEQERARRRPPPLVEPLGERNTLVPVASRKGLEQLKLLFDYSKFQIGLCTSVAIIFAAAFAFQPVTFKLHRGFLFLAVILICLAGLAAGIIASRCAHFATWSELWTAKIGPFRWNCLQGEYWTYLQHACFGLALASAVLAVLLGRS